MKKLWRKRKLWLSYLLLSVLSAVLCAVFVWRLGLFGAKVDWISQHSVLPDYFRRSFYETGQLFPEFALNIGGGQNIYNFSYYGLYSPVVLLSYLLPFIKMSDYMMAAQFLCLTASVLLLYGWLRRRGFRERIAFGVAVIFLLAGPMIFHSYNQTMFVNYMPFLCMGFLGVDRYFEEDHHRKSGLLIISVFLMIMTSFYFSVGGMLVLTLYGLHRYFEKCGGKVGFRKFIWEGVRFLMPMLLAVVMSGILLVPTAMALSGRSGGGGSSNLSALFIPQLSVDRFFYTPYGIGLTTLGVTALAAMAFFGKRHEKILAWACIVVLTVPLFAYMLNGGLYIRDKVMIPFLPLLCYLIACYLDAAEAGFGKFIGLWAEGIPYIVPLVLVFLGRQQGDVGKYWELVILDGVVMLLCYLLFYKKRNSVLLLIPAVIFLAIFGVVLNARADRAVSREFYAEVTEEDIGEMVTEVLQLEEGFYRTEQLGTNEVNAANLNRIWDMGQYVSSLYSSSYNTKYQEFREDIFQLEEPFRNFLMQPAVYNPVYQKFMGVKYILSKKEIPGYEAVKTKGEWNVYENAQVSPIAYATGQIMAEEEYEKLEFPYNQLAFLDYAVVENADAIELAGAEDIIKKDQMTAVDLEIPKMIQSGKKETIKIDISNYFNGQPGTGVLFLKFEVKNYKPSKDISVSVEGIRNKLTSDKHFYYNDNTVFTYAVPLKEGQKQIEVTFGKGKYEIKNAECFVGKLSETAGLDDVQAEDTGQELYQSEFRPEKEKTKGNVISGKIDVKGPGYFITTIPYDKNFEILVDGDRVKGKIVNQAFLGFDITEGQHEVKITYHAPGAAAGKLLSMLGIVLTAVVMWMEKKEKI